MATASTNTKTLDHIVHLLPPSSVEETSQQFHDLGFKVIPGGQHVGGLTANALVVFADGLYLELLSFMHFPSHYPPGSPERIERDNHPWANKPLGWIEYASLGNGSHTTRILDIINDRAKDDGSGAFYETEKDGARKRPDGQVVRWLISAPRDKKGTLPFFCGDVTPRDLRVLSKPPANVQHPSTAQGGRTRSRSHSQLGWGPMLVYSRFTIKDGSFPIKLALPPELEIYVKLLYSPIFESPRPFTATFLGTL